MATLVAGVTCVAGDWPGAERRVGRLEHTEDGIRTAHETVIDFPAVVLPEELQLQVDNPSEATAEPTTDGELMLKCRRWGVFAMGSELSAEDAKQLPYLSGSIIRSHVRNHFLSIQGRVATTDAGIPYVLDLPLVAVVKYNELEETSISTELVDRSTRDIRSHGLLIEKAADGSMVPPRTMAFSIRNTRAVAQADGTDQLVPHYEYMFIHGQPSADGKSLRLHGFGTTHYRTRIHCFTERTVPSQLSDCAIQGMITFTAYSYAGTVPKDKATRKVKLNERTACNISRLNEWLAERELTGDAWDHLPLIFDAMLDGKAPKDEPPHADLAPVKVTSLPKKE